MKCQILFSRKIKKNITNLSSAESVHSIVSDFKGHCFRHSYCIYPRYLS